VATRLNGSGCRLGWRVRSVEGWVYRLLDGVVIVEGEGAVLGVNLGRPIVTNGDFVMRLFPNYFGHDLFLIFLSHARVASVDLY